MFYRFLVNLYKIKKIEIFIPHINRFIGIKEETIYFKVVSLLLIIYNAFYN